MRKTYKIIKRAGATEYRVREYRDGISYPPADYFTPSLKDARETKAFLEGKANAIPAIEEALIELRKQASSY